MTAWLPWQYRCASRPRRVRAPGALLEHGSEEVSAIAGRLRQALEQAGYRVMPNDPRAFWMKFQSVAREDWTGQKLDVTSWEDELSFMMWTLQALNGLSFILILILILIFGRNPATIRSKIMIRSRKKGDGGSVTGQKKTCRVICLRGSSAVDFASAILLDPRDGRIGAADVPSAPESAKSLRLQLDSGQAMFVKTCQALTGTASPNSTV
jgi:hypothetical protein